MTSVIAQHQIKMKAYAMLRLNDKDVPLTTKEALLGRSPHCTNLHAAKGLTSKVHVAISDSSRVSRTACRIYLDQEADLFALENLSKNVILVDR